MKEKPLEKQAAHVQSRGRARAAGGRFVLLLEKGDARQAAFLEQVSGD